MTDSERTIAKDELVKLLASALGQEKSEEVVLATSRTLGFEPTSYSASEARALFDALAKADGLVGVVARFAVSRGDVDALVEAATSQNQSSRQPRDVDPSSAEVRLAAVDLLPLLAPALGTEKARDAVAHAAQRLQYDPRSLTRDQALAILDHLTQEDGILGVVARFAKARFVLEP